MLLKCPVCGCHVLKETAVEIPVEGEIHRYCSMRCASSEEAGPARTAPPAPLAPAPRHIVVPVDGSGPALRAVEHAAALAAASGGEVRILHALEWGWLETLRAGAESSAASRLGLDTKHVIGVIEEEAQLQMERCRKLCESGGVKCSTRVETKPPLEAILEASREADLIVIGSRGLGAVAGTVLGSLSMRVVVQADCPVMVVH